MVEPAVYQALSKPLVGPLDPYFMGVLGEIRAMLRSAFATRNPATLVVPGTGSAGMEAAIANFIEPGSKVVVLHSGYFASRMAEMSSRHGAVVATLEKPWGDTFGYDEVAEYVRREKPAAIAFVHAETSTGALQDPRPIVRAAREVGAITIVDAVTSLGAMPVQIDETGIDVAYSCSQKGLSCPPGLAPITASPRAMDTLNARRTPLAAWYLDLRLLAQYFDAAEYHHTASANLFYALHEGLRLIHEEGLENRFARHLRAHDVMLNGLEGLGLRLHVKEGFRIPHVFTPRAPEGVDVAKVRRYLLEKHGIEIAIGRGPLLGKIFRIGIIGPMANQDCVEMFLAKFAEALGAV